MWFIFLIKKLNILKHIHILFDSSKYIVCFDAFKQRSFYLIRFLRFDFNDLTLYTCYDTFETGIL